MLSATKHPGIDGAGGTAEILRSAQNEELRCSDIPAEEFVKKIAKRFTIVGRVQGVGFRFFAENWANRLGLSGYVKNCADGTVEAYAVGDAAAVDEFKSRLAEGPRGARVDQVQECEEQVTKSYRRFVIESDW